MLLWAAPAGSWSAHGERDLNRRHLGLNRSDQLRQLHIGITRPINRDDTATGGRGHHLRRRRAGFPDALWLDACGKQSDE